MNNGNLLDSLLATSNASTAPKKTAKPQRQTSSAEGFQNTLEQLRPKVAARKPEPTAARAEPHARTDSHRPDVQEPKPDIPAQARARSDNHQERPAATTPASDSSHSTTNDHQSPNAKVSATEGEQLTEEVLVEEGLASGLSTDTEAALLTELADDQLIVTNTDATSLPLEENIEGFLLSLEQPGISLAETTPELVSELQLAGVLNPAADTEAILPPAFANQLAAMSGTPLSGTAASPLTPLANNGVSTHLLTPELMAEGETLALSQEGDSELLVADGEVSDNPDLLLLNAKTIMNKLAEASASSLDKGSPAGDLPKALTAAAPAVEALSRMNEAQSPAARSFVVQTGVPVALGQPQWGQAVGERVLWLAAQNVSAAEIRLDPPELGPMQVRVSVNQEQVNVSFTSPHPAVREVLDQQLNRLREMFSEQGLNLVDVDVSDKSFAQQDQERGESRKNGTSAAEDEELAPLTSSILVSNRLVDHYA